MTIYRHVLPGYAVVSAFNTRHANRVMQSLNDRRPQNHPGLFCAKITFFLHEKSISTAKFHPDKNRSWNGGEGLLAPWLARKMAALSNVHRAKVQCTCRAAFLSIDRRSGADLSRGSTGNAKDCPFGRLLAWHLLSREPQTYTTRTRQSTWYALPVQFLVPFFPLARCSSRSRLYFACALLLNSWGSWILQRWPRSWTFNRPWYTRAEQHRVSCRCMPNDASRNSDLGAIQWLRTKEGKRAANSLSVLAFYIHGKQASISATCPFLFLQT